VGLDEITDALLSPLVRSIAPSSEGRTNEPTANRNNRSDEKRSEKLPIHEIA
jgi:hypothetical protein